MFVRSLTVLALLLLSTALPVVGQGKERGALWIDLNIPEQLLRVYEGDELIRTYPVSVGLPGHDTPDGEFTITRAEWNPWWRPPAREWAKNDKVTPPGPNNPMGRVKLFFAPYYYIHGTPHEKELGTPASHGCVRMKNSDVIALARLIHERAQPTVAPAEIAGILAKPTVTRHSAFRAPVPLHLRYEPVVVANGELRIYRDFYKRGRVHAEAIYQALLAAGYEVEGIERSALREMSAQAGRAKGTFVVKLSDAFGGKLAASR